ncbi:class A beta-lactamase-related serine hydrolase [Rhodococcoides corynebacterioides]|nr:class A beta-lactamase-related serine hydrolase [Rhodococcus corynebacterioides]
MNSASSYGFGRSRERRLPLGRVARWAVVPVAAMAVACGTPSGAMVTDAPPAPPFPAPEMSMAPDPADRLQQAVDGAAERGATVSIAYLDRQTDTYRGIGDDDPVETASVVKLFVADDLLMRSSRGEIDLPAEVRDRIAPMLSSSDDDAAQVLWDYAGGSDLVGRVAERYGLTATTASDDGIWWNTRTTARDLIGYYDGLLDGRGGLSPTDRDTVTTDLERYTPLGADGYPQTFGIPRALSGETTRGVKQGWMCCVDGRWIHLSTGFVGADRRYVLAVLSREDPWYGAAGGREDTTDTDVVDDDGAKHARITVTGAVTILFPDGVID